MNAFALHSFLEKYFINTLWETEKVPQRTCVTKILPNFGVNLIVRFASKPWFYWIVPCNCSEILWCCSRDFLALGFFSGPWLLDQGLSASSKSTQICTARLGWQSSPARGYKLGSVCSWMAGLTPARGCKFGCVLICVVSTLFLHSMKKAKSWRRAFP